MRITYDFYGKHPQVSFSGRPYSRSVLEPPRNTGGSVDGIIVDGNGESCSDQDEVLYLHGDLEAMRTWMREALEQLDSIAEDFEAEFKAAEANVIQCNMCRAWYDVRRLGTHVDGHGNRCPGEHP